ncbi:Pro-resilin-like 95 [Homarus americanus]|uniref:Pro-resilin-like 95 n=1 Tax=Homarus americanus TaxID=6706 RepID=A0A8J5MPU0_HOMAM|nr:Pro-resilin-like 95 [Homarus americanus]
MGKVIVLAALLVSVLARASNLPHSHHDSPANYEFQYAVTDEYSANDFGQQESRDGDYTQGSYYVLLPDGRRQKVTYTVTGDSGYVAEVTYEGQVQYPTS